MALDIRSILDVYPNDPSFTCVGTTQKGSRCLESFIQNAYLSEADDILDKLPEIVGSSGQQYELLSNLRQLAYLTLCPRWHQSKLPQVEPVAAKWLSRIQNIAVQRPAYSLLTPPPTPPIVPTRILYQSVPDHPPPHSVSRNIVYQPAVASPPPTAVTVPVTNMSPNHSQQYTSSAEPSIFQQRRGHTSQTGRNVNITFNIAVDSNQISQDRTGGPQVHDVTTDLPSPSSSRLSSRRSSASSSRRSTTSSTSSSTSSSSSRDPRDIEMIAALLAENAALRENQAAQAQSPSPRSSRSSSHSTAPSSPVLSEVSSLDLPSPRIRTLTSSNYSSHSTSRSQAESSTPEPEDSDDSDFEPGSSSSSNSRSDRRQGRPRTRINTPSSSGSLSPVIVSPLRPSRSSTLR